jgi:hypothetical protein
MGLRQEAEPSDTACIGKLVPLRIPNGPELESLDNLFKKFTQDLGAPKGFGGTSMRVNYPFNSAHIFAKATFAIVHTRGRIC